MSILDPDNGEPVDPDTMDHGEVSPDTDADSEGGEAS